MAEPVSLWAFLTEVLVPVGSVVLAGVIAGKYISQQIGQLEIHRVEDRRAEAITAALRMLYQEVDLAKDRATWNLRDYLRFQNGELLIRAYALIPKPEQDVIRWTTVVRQEISDHIDRAIADVDGPNAGPSRAEAAKVAALAVEQLLLWQAGEIDTAWFTEQYKQRRQPSEDQPEPEPEPER